MLNLLKPLLGINRPGPAPPASGAAGSIASLRPQTSESQNRSDAYFAIMAQMQEAISKRDYERAAGLTRENLRQIPAFVKATRRQSTSFDIRSIPALASIPSAP